MYIFPEEPELVEPLENTRAPLEPLVPLFADEIDTRPLDEEVP
jgi:hypothetical protein